MSSLPIESISNGQHRYLNSFKCCNGLRDARKRTALLVTSVIQIYGDFDHFDLEIPVACRASKKILITLR